MDSNINKLRNLTVSLNEREETFFQKNKKLIESNSFLQNVLNSLPALVFVKDIDSRFVYVNSKLCSLYGLRKEEIEGKRDSDLGIIQDFNIIHSNDIDVITNRIEKVINTESLKDRFGNIRYFSLVKKPLIELDGSCSSLLAIGTEITDIIEMQQRLTQSNERFELAASASDHGLWDWMDVRYDEEWWSPKYFEILGYENQEFLPSFEFWKKKLVHPEDLPFLEAKLKSCFANPQEKWQVQYRMKLKSGEYRWFKTVGDIQRSPTGQPIRMLGFTHDINDRIEYKNKLEKDRKKYYFILEAVLDGLLVADKDGKILFVNSHFLKMTNHSIYTILGNHINILLDPEFVNTHNEYISNYLSGEAVRNIMGKTGREVKIKTFDNKYIDVNLAVTDIVVDGERLFIATASEIKKEKNDN